jgi:DinB superfamily
MESTLKIWKTSRNIVLNYFNTYTLEQLNKVPQGFNNNLIWNIGHVIVAQQSLVYRSSNLPMRISDAFFDQYKSGTKPDGKTSAQDAEELKEKLISLIGLTEADLSAGLFKSFNERTTGTGFHLASLKDALEFNNYHEGLHLGVMMSIRKLV